MYKNTRIEDKSPLEGVFVYVRFTGNSIDEQSFQSILMAPVRLQSCISANPPF